MEKVTGQQVLDLAGKIVALCDEHTSSEAHAVINNFYKYLTGLFLSFLGIVVALSAAKILNRQWLTAARGVTGELLAVLLTLIAGILFYHGLLAVGLLAEAHHAVWP